MFMEMQWRIQGCSPALGLWLCRSPSPEPGSSSLCSTPAALGVLLMALPCLQLLSAFVSLAKKYTEDIFKPI